MTITTVQEAWNKRRELHAEGSKLYSEGYLVFYNAVLSVHGNVEIEWVGNDAIVCGTRYEFVEKAACEERIMEIDGVRYKLTKM